LDDKYDFFLADAEDVLAPALFRGGVRGTRTEGFLLPIGNITLNYKTGGSASSLTETTFNQETKVIPIQKDKYIAKTLRF